MTKIRIAIHGAAGRMGRRLIALGAADPQLSVAAALESSENTQIGEDAGPLAGMGPIGVPLTAELLVPVDVVIDFSVPKAAMQIIETCRQKKLPLVLATTGFEVEHVEQIHAAAAEIPLLWSPSMSLSVNLAMKLCELAGKALADKDADVEIVERHHRFKEDAPSGTALKFGQIIAAQMGQTEHVHGRGGRPGKRPHGEIGYHAIRVGDNPGEHTIIFAMLGETLEITVAASNRDCYAQGALAAAKFLAGQAAGDVWDERRARVIIGDERKLIMYDGFWEEVERSKRMTPEQRLRGTLEMIDLVHELRMAGIRHDFPDADQAEVLAILRKRIELAERLGAVR